MIKPILPFDFRMVAVEIDYDECGDFEDARLLVERTSDHSFITYRMDDNGNCHGGNYDMTLDVARIDFDQRVAGMRTRFRF